MNLGTSYILWDYSSTAFTKHICCKPWSHGHSGEAPSTWTILLGCPQPAPSYCQGAVSHLGVACCGLCCLSCAPLSTPVPFPCCWAPGFLQKLCGTGVAGLARGALSPWLGIPQLLLWDPKLPWSSRVRTQEMTYCNEQWLRVSGLERW